MRDFTKQELLILNLVAKGLMNREIAEELSMSNSTTKVQAVVKAITLQIIKV